MTPSIGEFLVQLRASGIAFGPEEYERLRRLLHCRADWTQPRLRSCLGALLAKDPEQQRRFQEHFDLFFPPGEVADLTSQVPAWLEQARRLAQPPSDVPIKPTSSFGSSPAPPRPVPRKPWLWKLLGGLALTAALAIAFFLPRTQKLSGEIHFFPSGGIQFGVVEVAKAGSGKVELVNKTRSTQHLQAMEAEGEHAAEFSFAGADLSPLPAGAARALPLRFAPGAEGARTAALRLRCAPGAEGLTSAGAQILRLPVFGTATALNRQPPPKLQNPVFETKDAGKITAIHVSVEPLPVDRTWLWALLASGLLAAFLIGYLRYLRRWRRLPQDPPLLANPEAEGSFRFSAIGGAVPPWLQPREGRQAADAVARGWGERASQVLDVPRSIQRTLSLGGCPSPAFQPRRRLHSVLVLEDEATRPWFQGPLARELGQQLAQQAIVVLPGKLRGRDGRVFLDDGEVTSLAALEADREHLEVLLFTDSGGFSRGDCPSLQRLREWPRVAWLEQREPCFQGPSADWPRQQGLPVFPATPQGVVEALCTLAQAKVLPDRKSPPLSAHPAAEALPPQVLTQALVPSSRIRFKIRLFSARFVAQSVEDQRSDFPFGL